MRPPAVPIIVSGTSMPIGIYRVDVDTKREVHWSLWYVVPVRHNRNVRERTASLPPLVWLWMFRSRYGPVATAASRILGRSVRESTIHSVSIQKMMAHCQERCSMLLMMMLLPYCHLQSAHSDHSDHGMWSMVVLNIHVEYVCIDIGTSSKLVE